MVSMPSFGVVSKAFMVIFVPWLKTLLTSYLLIAQETFFNDDGNEREDATGKNAS